MVPDIQIDWTQDPRTLRDIYKKLNFDNEFYKLIRNDVISILCPQLYPEPHNITYSDNKIQQQLIGPLERLIFGLDKNSPQEELDKLIGHIKTLKQPSRLCRKVLKAGDVLFSCNDCGFDGTCVVCIDCFHKSAHKDHNYRMSNTDGGGCCDCGDIEAWKQHPACSDHMALDQPNLSLADFEDIELRKKQIESDKSGILEKISLLPAGTAERFFIICQACLHYARLMLTWTNYNSLPDNLEIIDDDKTNNPLLSRDLNTKNFFTVLFNDELHTYDYVISTLVKTIKCTEMTASIMASTVSREGRSFVFNSAYRECKHIKEAIVHVRDTSQGPLKVDVIHGTLLAHQTFAVKLIGWIRRMSSLCDAFRIITAYTLLGSCDPMPDLAGPSPSSTETLLERLMLTNTVVWKEARVDWNDLFVSTLLTEYSIKDKFARLITRIYPRLIQDYIDDDHDHSVSILTMTTQLYTVPSLVCMLIEEENALQIISQALLDTCKNTKREGAPLSFETRHTFDINSLKRGFSIIVDLKHLINIEPTKWTSRLRMNVIEAVKIFLNLLSSMQGMDSVRRQLGQHLEYEPEWETGMTLQSRLISFISRLVYYCSLDEEVLCETLKETQSRLFKNYTFKTITRELFGHQTGCIQYDVSTSPVSVHLPLTRFAGALIVELMRRRPSKGEEGGPYDESLVILTSSPQSASTASSSSSTLEPEDQSETSKHSMIDIMEHSLRTQVMVAQFRSGMWRRNGYSLVNQVVYFSGALMRKEMCDRDILILQECAATCEANKFLIHLLNKFNLFTWVTSETTREPLVGPKVSYYNDEEILTQTMSSGEEFLRLLLTCIGERYQLGIGMIQPDDVMKNEIIQLLCIGPLTRSDLTQKLYVFDNELDCVKAVANLRRSTESSTGKYELKEELYDRFNPFFYHYSRRNQSHALDVQLKRKKNLKQSLICCPPPAPVELTEQFRNLNELLKCDITLIIIQKILRRTLGPPENSQECSTKAPITFSASDLQLDLCLHLIGLGLYEQERNPLKFAYIEAAYEKDIFNLLRESYEKAKRSKDLIHWIMLKTSNLIDSIDTNELSDYKNRVYSSVKARFSSILTTCDTVKQENKKRSSEMAAERRNRILAQMRAKQNEFLSNPSTQQLLSETESRGPSRPSEPPAAAAGSANSRLMGTPGGSQPTKAKQTKSSGSSAETAMLIDSQQQQRNDDDDDDDAKSMDTETVVMMDEDADEEVPCQIEESHLCILCRDEQKVAFDKPAMVLLATIQRSAVLSKNRQERRIPNYSLTPSNRLKSLGLPDVYSFTSDNSMTFDVTYMPADLVFGPHISTCGHALHYECWKGYFDVVYKRETNRPNRSARHTSFDLEKSEILCPLCECISNALIPLLPDFTCFVRRRCRSYGPLGGTIFGTSKLTLDKSSGNLSACLHALRGTVDMLEHIRLLKDGHVHDEPGHHEQRAHEDKYMRLLRPKLINDVLEKLDEPEALLLRDFIATIRGQRINSNACTKQLLSSISALTERIHSVGLDIGPSQQVHQARVFMMTSWSLAYTIQANEQASRFKGTPLFEDIESPKNLCLSSLVRFSLTSLMTYQSDLIQSLLVKKLRYLLINEEHLSSSLCCLDVDAFEMFVSVFILLQKLHSHLDDSSPLLNKQEQSTSVGALSSSFKSTSSRESNEENNHSWTTSAYDHEYFRNLLHLMVILNLVQVIITMQTESQETKSDDHCQRAASASSENSTTNEVQALHNFYKDIIFASGHPNSKLLEPNERLVERVRCRLLPYLRSCALFFHHLSHIKPPEILQTNTALFEGKNFASCTNEACWCHQKTATQTNKAESRRCLSSGGVRSSQATTGGGDFFARQKEHMKQFDMVNFEASNAEFAALCKYLDLPGDFDLLLQSREVRHLANSWLRHSRVLLLIKSSALKEDEQDDAINKSPAIESNTASPNELMPIKLIYQPRSVNRLIDLPYDYSELVDRVSDFTCPSNRNEDSRTPTMCLVCGVMLCSQSYCCQRDLNDLASNYQEILRRQEETRRELLLAASKTPSSSSSSSSSSSMDSASQRSTSGVRAALGFHFLPATTTTTTTTNPIPVPSAGVVAAAPVAAANLTFAPLVGGVAGAPTASNSRALETRILAGLPLAQQLVGSCTYHAHECTAGVGLFLRIRNCQILMLNGRSKGCYMPAPYIDDHGETDFGLSRGNPLHLNREHYERLQHMWMNHSIPEQISRSLEYSSYGSSVNWHLH